MADQKEIELVAKLKEVRGKEKSLVDIVKDLSSEEKSLIKKSGENYSESLNNKDYDRLYLACIFYIQEEPDPNRVIECINELLTKDKNDYILYYNRGYALIELKQYDEAIVNYNKVIELSPDFLDAFLGRGVGLMNLEKYMDAIKDFTTVINLKYHDIWKPYRNRSVSYKGLAVYFKDRLAYNEALDNIKKALNDIDEAIKLKPNDTILKDEKKNILDTEKLILESINSTATVKEVEEMRKQVKEARDKIEAQEREAKGTLNEVIKLQSRVKEQSNEYEQLTKNIKSFEDKFISGELQIKALDSSFKEDRDKIREKKKKSEETIFWRALTLSVVSAGCVLTIGLVIKNNNQFIVGHELFLLYMIALTAIVLTPLIWMLRLAIKSRNELMLLETEYCHKTSLATSLYAFKLTLGDSYSKELSKMAFEVLFGQNPATLLTDGNSLRIKNKKESDYPHIAMELLKNIAEKAADKAIEKFDKKEE